MVMSPDLAHQSTASSGLAETGGDSFEAEREQWDDGNNVVARTRCRHRL
jgi:arginine deiminase